MAVPSHDLSTGMYFGSINGYSASSFETVQHGGEYSFQPACMTPAVAYFIDSSGTITDMNSLAIMPYRDSGSWITSTEKSRWFNQDFSWSPTSSRVGYNFIRHKTPSKTYPLSLARRGYRTYTVATNTFENGTEHGYSVRMSYSYDFWANVAFEGINTATNSPLFIYLDSSGYRTSLGETGYWRNNQGSAVSRTWVGVFLQAGGAEGGKCWINHVGGGGSAGGAWLGLIDVSSGTTTINVGAYSASGGDGRAGSKIVLSNSRCTITVNNGVYTTGGSQGGISAGGTVTTSGSGFITYKNITGGNGGYDSDKGENRIYVSSLSAPTYDQKSIPLSNSSMLSSLYSTVWWGGGKAGQGGMTILGAGGIPATGDSSTMDAGAGGKYKSYGAGGGGNSGGDWFGKPGGSGGYPYVSIGY